jgi:hypothetical protein
MSEWRRWERQHCGRTVLLAATGPDRWLLVEPTWWDRLRARWHALTLDTQLARGVPPAGDRLLAVRAGMLVAPSGRHRLAVAWEAVLSRAPAPRAAVPLQRSRVNGAAGDIRELVAALRTAGPVSVRGVAAATLLLTDGRPPVYFGRTTVDLRDAVQVAGRLLDPIPGAMSD